MINAPGLSLGQTRTWVGAALAATLPVVLAASGATGGSGALSGGQTHRGGGSWSGTTWMGDGSTGTGTTLAQVKTAIGAGTGTAATLTGAGVGIALIDTGVANLPGLPAAQIVNGPDLSFESQSPELRYQDTYGHGTHMAGIIVGNDTETGTKGLAPKAKITSIKVGVSNGAVDVSQVLAAIDWAVVNRNHDPANPIRVINLSYRAGATATSGLDLLSMSVKLAWRKGIVVVASAGNDNPTVPLTNPASDSAIISVGATSTMGTAATTDDQVAPFSNGTPTLLAPGTSVVSLRDAGSNIDQTYPTARVGETLFRGSGTSQSAAVTSAAVALLLQHRPTLTPDEVKKILVDSASPIMVGTTAAKKLRQINVAAALARTSAGSVAAAWVNGLPAELDATRGAQKVVHNNVPLSGTKSAFGAFDKTNWFTVAIPGTAWNKGLWVGRRIAGDGFTGTSWASKTWATATWAGGPWSGAATWQDPDWSGRYWAGRYWAGRYWAGQYWSTSEWSTATWN